MNYKRQLKDIQSQADKLLTSKPNIGEIEEFDKYNLELKSFLSKNITEEDIVERIEKIPPIIERKDTVKSNFIFAIVSLLIPSAGSYIHNKQLISKAKENIRTAKSYYSSIEFLSKNLD